MRDIQGTETNFEEVEKVIEAMPKIYSIEVVLHATAYVRASSEEEAKKKIAISEGDGIETSEDETFTGVQFDRLLDTEDFPDDITFSPVMTVGKADLRYVDCVEGEDD